MILSDYSHHCLTDNKSAGPDGNTIQGPADFLCGIDRDAAEMSEFLERADG